MRRRGRFERNLEILDTTLTRAASGNRVPCSQVLRQPEVRLQNLHAESGIPLRSQSTRQRSIWRVLKRRSSMRVTCDARRSRSSGHVNTKVDEYLETSPLTAYRIVPRSGPAADANSTRHACPGAEDSRRDAGRRRGVVRVRWPVTTCVSVEFRSRLASRALRAQLSLNSSEVEQLDAFYELLVRWNRRINLTALPLVPLVDATLDRFFVEPLAAARLMASDPLEWIDLGSGGGSPAVPLKFARPAARLTMIEARTRKAAFLREVARELDLRDVQVVGTRFEEVQPSRGDATVDLVTVRAVRIDETLLANARRFLRCSGRLFLFTNEPVSEKISHPSFRSVQSEALVPGDFYRLAVFERLWSPDRFCLVGVRHPVFRSYNQ